MRIKPIILKGQTQIDHAIQTLKTLPTAPVMEISFRQAQSERSIAQNNKMWAMLSDVSKQVDWHGRKMKEIEWKSFFSASLLGQLAVPNMDNSGFIVLGISTSKMSIKMMIDMVDLMYAFGAEHKVHWSDPTQPNYD